MNKYQEMKQRHGEDLHTIPFGFACGEEQFRRMMLKWGLDPQRDIDKLCIAQNCIYLQQKDEWLLNSMTARHKAELQAAIDEDKTGDGFIYQMFLTELFNHEYGFTEDESDALEALGLTMKDIETDTRLQYGFEKACKRFGKSV